MAAEVLEKGDSFLAEIDGTVYYIEKKLMSGGIIRHFKSKFPGEFKKIKKSGRPTRIFKDATLENINAIYKKMMDEPLEEQPPSYEGDSFLPVDNSLPGSNRIGESDSYDDMPFKETKNNDRKEFVIDVTGLDIKREIQQATVDFVKLNCEASFEKELTKIVDKAVEKLTPNLIKIGKKEAVKIAGRQHKMFEKVLFNCQHYRQSFISGPAGSGKTYLGQSIAKAFELPFDFLNCTAGMSEAWLLGRMLMDGTYVASGFINIFENGGVFLLDEVDAADANTLLVINSALANGIVAVPSRKDKPTATRHKDCIIICSANTWGNGSFEYQGRNQMDAAFMDRFTMSKVFIDYDTKLEKEYCSTFPDLAKVLWSIRKECAKNKVRKIVSTRAFKDGAIAILAGETLPQVIKTFFTGWSKEEIVKVYDESKLGKITEEEVVEEEEVQNG